MIEAVKISRAPMLTLAAVGLFWGAIAGLMPDIKAAIGATDATMGLILIMPAIGSMIAMWLAPRIGTVLRGWAMPLSGLGIAGSFFLPALAEDAVMLGLAMFVGGGAVALADMTANVRIAGLEARRGLHLQNLNHAMFSLAFGSTAFCVAFARAAGMHYPVILYVIAGVTLFVVLAGWDRSVLPPVGEEANTAATPPWGTIALAAAILFSAFIGENATEAWSALHIERTLGAAPGHGSFGPAMMGFIMAAGRLSGQMLAARLGEARLILFSALLGSAGALILAAAPTVAVALGGVSVLGLGMAVIVPSTNSILGRAVSDAARPIAISRAWMMALMGFFIGPAMMGALAEIWSLRLSFAAVAVLVALIVPAVQVLARR